MAHDFTLASKTNDSCLPAVAPNVWQYSVVHDSTTPVAPVAAQNVAAGSAAFYGGRLAVEGCQAVEFTLVYLDGGVCSSSSCVPAAALTNATITLTVDPKVVSAISIPDGYWQTLSYEVVDANGTPVAIPATETVLVYGYSACVPNPCCPVNAI